MNLPDPLVRLNDVGWAPISPDPQMHDWVNATKQAAFATLDAPEHAHWWRHANTWFAGVNALDNDANGAVRGGPDLIGKGIDLLRKNCPDLTWDRAQISVCRPGYPTQENESDASYAFRRDRDAAHLDGLLPVGAGRRRHMQEFHRFILGIPLNVADENASPMVVWEGSHHLVQNMLRDAYAKGAAQDWSQIDVTDAYVNLRRRVFSECARRVVTVPVGGCYIVHRHLIHGVQPWREAAHANPLGRAIAYFRPAAPDLTRWLSAAPLV